MSSELLQSIDTVLNTFTEIRIISFANQQMISCKFIQILYHNILIDSLINIFIY